MRLGVDASNIRAGGGVTHLVSTLAAADPAAQGISRVLVWGGRATLDQLPRRPWLEPVADPALDGSLARRLAWQRYALPRLGARAVDLVWVLGGNAGGRLRSFVAMSQNMLPFEPAERRRYGLSWMRFRLALLARSQSRTFARADGVLFLTRYARDVVTARVPGIRGASEIVPHGVDERFRLEPRAQRAIESFDASRPFRLLAVSIVDVYKHPWVLAEAVARLRSRGLPLALDLVGPAYPPALARLRRVLRRVDPDGRGIRYVGNVPFASLHERYHAADGFLFASSCENMPNILLEAMAAGLPIACSDRGPMPEVLGPGASYFDPEDLDSTVRSIEGLVRDVGSRTRCARDAYDRALTFTWERCAAETLAFLTRVHQGRRLASGGESSA